MTDTQKSAKRTTASETSKGFTLEERAAMKERAKELKAAANKEDSERDVLAKIAEMPASDRAMAERIHAVVKDSAPGLTPRTWYGMPAYARDGKIVCFFQAADKFKARYATFGFSDEANLALNLSALWKKQTILPSLAYAGIPYQVLGERSGALALTTAWIRSAMARSESGISAIFASTSRSLSSLFEAAFSSFARSFIAAFSSGVNPVGVSLAGVRLADFFVSFMAGFLCARSDGASA